MDLRIDIEIQGSKEVFGPYRIYHLSRGLTVDFSAMELIVRGGASLSKTLPLPPYPCEEFWVTPETSFDMLNKVERDIGVKVVGVSGSKVRANLNPAAPEFQQLSELQIHELPPEDALFRVNNFAISAGYLAKELLAKITLLEALVRRAVHSDNVARVDVQRAGEICANLNDHIVNEELGPGVLEELIQKLRQIGVPISEGFFVFNAGSIAEDMRSAVLRACHHFTSMTAALWRLNQNPPLNLPSGGPLAEPGEVVHSSGEVDILSHEYTSAVIACYSSLDMLYGLFVYLTREPFGDPSLPKRLHFPDWDPTKAFQQGGGLKSHDLPASTLPYAIPNLAKGKLMALRGTRNDLVHNMASDGFRPRAYSGLGLAPVNHQLLQYTQYITRDISPNGEPVAHPWSRRFYQSHIDAQEQLHDWLAEAWQCIFDTTEWLIHRLRKKVGEVSPLD